MVHPLLSRISLNPRGQRGFTLTELMVALTGGLLISTMVFVLARDSTRFYQRESRMANANLAEIIGFQRLSADISRAGFLSTSNIRRESNLCGDPVGDATDWPKALRELASIRIENGQTMPGAMSGQVAPRRLRLAGSYLSADEFPVRLVLPNADNTVSVFLQVNSGPMARLGYRAGPADATQVATLNTVFAPNRALRLVDSAGGEHYGTISSTVGGNQPAVILSNKPPLRFRAGAGNRCGIRGFETGALANVVNIIQYEIRDISDASKYANFARAFSDNTDVKTATFDATRRDLIRVELNVNTEEELPETVELIAEYAVDLRFGLTVMSNASTSAKVADPQLTTLISNLPNEPTTHNAEIAKWAGLPSALNANVGPEFIRSVRLRFSVRSREPDRDTNIIPSDTVAPGLYRIGLGTDGKAPYARVRTMQADIALRNQTR